METFPGWRSGMKFPDKELKVGNSSALFCFKKRGRARADSVKDNIFLLRNVCWPFSRCWRSQGCLKAFWGGVSLGTQIPVMNSPLQFGHRSTWRSQKNNQLRISSWDFQACPWFIAVVSRAFNGSHIEFCQVPPTILSSVQLLPLSNNSLELWMFLDLQKLPKG